MSSCSILNTPKGSETLPQTGTLPQSLQRWMKQNATRRESIPQRTETLQDKDTLYVLPT